MTDWNEDFRSHHRDLESRGEADVAITLHTNSWLTYFLLIEKIKKPCVSWESKNKRTIPDSHRDREKCLGEERESAVDKTRVTAAHKKTTLVFLYIYVHVEYCRDHDEEINIRSCGTSSPIRYFSSMAVASIVCGFSMNAFVASAPAYSIMSS